MHLQERIKSTLRTALTGLTADIEPYVAMLKPTQDPKHGDYQANCAMSLAKLLRKKPRDVADEIVARFDTGEMLEAPEVAGPGFINLRLRPEWISLRLQSLASDERLGVGVTAQPKTFVVDFSGPNVAKPMHVGHLRSTIIGDSLIRVLRFLGHTVLGDNHLGDWGTQFGIILYGYKNLLDKEAFTKDPVRELARLYVEVRNRMKGDEEEEKAGDPIGDACRRETALLHAGDPENVRLWNSFMPYCTAEIDQTYRRLGVSFDYTLGESFYNPMLPGVVEDLLSKGIAQHSQGAVVIFFGEEEPPALIRKKDGAFTYTTTDLATIRYRIETLKGQALLYVVDARQALHFKHLFDAARRWGYANIAMEHVSFGSVLGKDGKPIKTREGGAVTLETLIDEAVRRALDVYRANRGENTDEDAHVSAEEERAISEAIGVGAMKYADLSQNRTSDYKFDFDKMLAMNGNTATYMQYAYARNRSILRKAGIDAERFRTNPPPAILSSPFERALAVQVLRLEEILAQAAAEYQPSTITSYLWDLAKTYSGFFQNCPVLRAESPELKESRLLLCDLTARVIQRCLDLLGIRTVERM
jgi:arginyl-tRNA synthetase